MSWVAILFFGNAAFVLGIILVAWRMDAGPAEFFFNRLEFGTQLSRRQYLDINQLLVKHSEYYAKLTVRGKARYVNRLVELLREKEWVGRNGLKITFEMKVLIAGAAVQLTYGLRRFRFSNINTFVLYPDIFKVPVLKQKLRGGTSPGGTVMLSWKHVVEGYADETDKLNLALHELAHALKLELTHGLQADRHFKRYLPVWFELGKPEFGRIRKGAPSFLRRYAGSNHHEFIAVCVEHFFEAPEAFAAELPDLFHGMCRLLNQDPRNPRLDYRLRGATPRRA